MYAIVWLHHLSFMIGILELICISCSRAIKTVKRLRATMPAKSLGTLAMIYAIVELQNPLPRKAMLWKGDMNVSASTSDTFLQR